MSIDGCPFRRDGTSTTFPQTEATRRVGRRGRTDLTPFVLKQISKEEAGALLAQMTERIGGTLEPADDEDEGEASVTSMHAAPAPNQSMGVSITLGAKALS